MPRVWKEAVVRLIPKLAAETAPGDPANFRPIAGDSAGESRWDTSDWSPETPPLQGRHLPQNNVGVGYG